MLSLALLGLAVLVALRFSAPRVAAAPAQAELESEPAYLDPGEMALSPDGSKLYVVCEGIDALLVVDMRSERVTGRVSVGHRPRSLALSPDAKTIYVSNEWDDTVSEIDAATLEVRRTMETGWGPVGVVTDAAGKFLYVANHTSDNVSVIDLESGREVKRLSAHRSPHHLARSRDGKRIYVSNVLPHLGPYDEPPVSELTIIDATRQVVRERVLIPGVIVLRHIAEAPGPEGGYLIVPATRPKNLGPLIRVEQGWVVTHGMAIVYPEGASPESERGTRVVQVLLDDIDYYYADGYGAAFTPDGRSVLISASGANLVSVVDTFRLNAFLKNALSPADGPGRNLTEARRFATPLPEGRITYASGSAKPHIPGLHVEFEWLANRTDSAQHFVTHRIPTGSDPRAVVVSPDGRTAYVANRLDDSISLIDLASSRTVKTIDLGGPKHITPRRWGERLFNDASYCLQGQFSCATCHPNDHVDGLAWNLETPQLGRDRVDNRTLRGIADTAPFKWNAHNPDLATQCGPRIAKFLFRSEGFNPEELRAVISFLNSIPLRPNRHLAPDGELTDAQERGRKIYFREFTNDGAPIPVQNRCATCHPLDSKGTNRLVADVGSANEYDTIKAFDVPQLDRVYDSAPYLHNGQAKTLEEIWTVFNDHDQHGVTSDLRKEQLTDLIEFLKTL
jgi:YVTN family beta-propeller protein